jgi:hypothetical protein
VDGAHPLDPALEIVTQHQIDGAAAGLVVVEQLTTAGDMAGCAQIQIPLVSLIVHGVDLVGDGQDNFLVLVTLMLRLSGIHFVAVNTAAATTTTVTPIELWTLVSPVAGLVAVVAGGLITLLQPLLGALAQLLTVAMALATLVLL